MKTMRSKRLLAMLLALAMLFTWTDWSVMTALAEEDTWDGSLRVATDRGPFTDEEMYPVVWEGRVSREDVDLNQMRDGGGDWLKLKDTNEVRWIDRIADLPEGYRNVYDALIEVTDGDGIDDVLIDSATAEEVWLKAETYFPVRTGETAYSVYKQHYTELFYLLWVTYACFENDHPEVFWVYWPVNATISYRQVEGGIVIEAYLGMITETGDSRPAKYRNLDTLRHYMDVRDRVIEELMEATAGYSVYESVRAFNRYLTMSNSYNHEHNHGVENDPWLSISALEGRTDATGPVCEGYAKAFKVLCDAAGIPCVLADSTSHMWNNVEVRGNWYAVDVTWNDPSGGPQPAVSGYENESYLLVGSETRINGSTFAERHVVENNTYSQGPCLTNGPQLSPVAFDPNVPFQVPVQVNYWFQKLGADPEVHTEANYEKKDSREYRQYTGTQFTPEVPAMEGFLTPVKQTITVIDGKNQIDYYYARQRYQVIATAQKGVSVAGGGVYEYETPVILMALPEAGYEFTGWFGPDRGSSDNVIEIRVPAHDVEYIAGSRPIVYTITYRDAYSVSNPTTYTVETETFTLQDPVREGYLFQGWLVEGSETPQRQVTIEQGSTGNRVFTAKWKHPHEDACQILHFTDVSLESWYHNAVEYVYVHGGLMNGTGDGTTFSPDGTTTRSMIVTILHRISGDQSADWTHSFTDVEAGSWYENAVAWAAQNQVVNGTGDGTTFTPDGKITREQFALMMYNFAKNYLDQDVTVTKDLGEEFPDAADVSSWVGNAMAWAVEQGLITGKSMNDQRLLDPQGQASRAEAATMIMRFHQWIGQ